MRKAIFAVLVTVAVLMMIQPAGLLAVKDGDKAPDFFLTSFEGKQYKLSAYKNKYIVLNFFGTFCEPCKKELPEIIKFYNEYKTQNVIVLLLSLDMEGRKVVAPFIKQFKPTMPVLLFADLQNKTYGVDNKLPTTFVIDKDGVIMKRLDGYQENMYDTLKGIITGTAEQQVEPATSAEPVKPVVSTQTVSPTSVQKQAPVAVSVKKTTVLIGEFESKKVPQEDASFVSELIRTALNKTGRFDVVDGSKGVGDENSVKAMLPCNSIACAVEMGRMFNVAKVITGSLSSFQGIYYVSVNVVDVETAKIVMSDKVTYKDPADIDIKIDALAGKVDNYFSK
jgi:peroxiredoxin